MHYALGKVTVGFARPASLDRINDEGGRTGTANSGTGMAKSPLNETAVFFCDLGESDSDATHGMPSNEG